MKLEEENSVSQYQLSSQDARRIQPAFQRKSPDLLKDLKIFYLSISIDMYWPSVFISKMFSMYYYESLIYSNNVNWSNNLRYGITATNEWHILKY